MSTEHGRAAQIGPQRGRDVDLSIGALVGLEDADERARQREARPVQRVDEAGLRALLIGSIMSPFVSLSEHSEAATLDDPVEITFENRYVHFTLEELWYFDQHTGEVLARYSNLRHQHHWALHVEYEPEHVYEISAFADGVEYVHRLNSVNGIHIDANEEVRLVAKSPYREPTMKITVNG